MSDLISSLYPPPPPYYRYFTPENLEKFQEWKQTNPDQPPSGELRLQVPPSKPESNQYRGYGSVWSLENELPSLKDSGWRQLYNDEDETITSQAKIDELHKLLDSLLLNFLELVASVSVEPAKFYVKIEHLKLILINMNHLLNTYRPHQTRESLIMLLQKQIDDKRSEISEIDRVCGEVREKISVLAAEEPDTVEVQVKEEQPEEKLGELEELKKLLQ